MFWQSWKILISDHGFGWKNVLGIPNKVGCCIYRDYALSITIIQQVVHTSPFISSHILAFKNMNRITG